MCVSLGCRLPFQTYLCTSRFLVPSGACSIFTFGVIFESRVYFCMQPTHGGELSNFITGTPDLHFNVAHSWRCVTTKYWTICFVILSEDTYNTFLPVCLATKSPYQADLHCHSSIVYYVLCLVLDVLISREGTSFLLLQDSRNQPILKTVIPKYKFRKQQFPCKFRFCLQDRLNFQLIRVPKLDTDV